MDEKDHDRKSVLELHPDSNKDLFQSWPELYALTEHWQSDMKFFRDELNFLNMLIDKYLLKLVEEDNVSKIAPLALALTKLEARNRTLEQKLVRHLHHIRELVENAFSRDSQAFKDEHLALENELLGFVKDFRITKEEMFASTEHVLKSEKAKHLIAR